MPRGKKEGCTIEQNKYLHERYADAAFVERCRFVAYDNNGRVMVGSYPGALPMRKIPHEVIADTIIIDRGT